MQVEETVHKREVAPREQVIARDVTFDAYLEQYAADFTEWIDGVVIKMSPVRELHDAIPRFIDNLFESYLVKLGGGRVLQAPFVMRLESQRSAREPDVQVLLPESMGRLKPTYVDGAADLVVEIISPESVERDRGDKFAEYERGGVKEYWSIDPIRSEALFYVLSSEGVYEPRHADTDGVYTSTVLPKLRLPVALLWQEPLPTIVDAVRMVEAMFAEGNG